MKKLVVITGASSGFGLEMAKLFNTDAYQLLLLSRNTSTIDTNEFNTAMIRNLDVADLEAFKTIINEAQELHGNVDLLINNAGVMLLGDVVEQDSNEWKTMFDTNVMGVLNGTQAVLETMKNNKQGTIINVSSIAGQKAFGNHAAYCGSKFAVHGITETIRQEASSSNVRVLLLSPGAAETNLLSHTTNAQMVADYKEWKKTMEDEKSLDPYYVALSAKFMYEAPQEVSIREITIAATMQDA